MNAEHISAARFNRMIADRRLVVRAGRIILPASEPEPGAPVQTSIAPDLPEDVRAGLLRRTSPVLAQAPLDHGGAVLSPQWRQRWRRSAGIVFLAGAATGAALTLLLVAAALAALGAP